MLPAIMLVLALISPLSQGLDSVVLASHSISLYERAGSEFVNGVFRDNILLTVSYMGEKVDSPDDISWEEVNRPFKYEFVLEPGQVFAFHDQVFPKYAGKVVKTTNAHFNYQDGFKSDGYLMGDGVCHLASLIYWVAQDAHLLAEAPTNHNFADIPEVPKEYGVSIFAVPNRPTSSSLQNLYITNNLTEDVRFIFEYENGVLTVSILR